MTMVESHQNNRTTFDKWLLLVAMTVYAVGVSVYQNLSITAMMREYGSSMPAVGPIWLFASYNFFWIVAYAVGFVLLAAILDRMTKRASQPLTAMSVGLAGCATVELFNAPLQLIGMRILMLFQ